MQSEFIFRLVLGVACALLCRWVAYVVFSRLTKLDGTCVAVFESQRAYFVAVLRQFIKAVDDSEAGDAAPDRKAALEVLRHTLRAKSESSRLGSRMVIPNFFAHSVSINLLVGGVTLLLSSCLLIAMFGYPSTILGVLSHLLGLYFLIASLFSKLWSYFKLASTHYRATSVSSLIVYLFDADTENDPETNRILNCLVRNSSTISIGLTKTDAEPQIDIYECGTLVNLRCNQEAAQMILVDLAEFVTLVVPLHPSQHLMRILKKTVAGKILCLGSDEAMRCDSVQVASIADFESHRFAFWFARFAERKVLRPWPSSDECFQPNLNSDFIVHSGRTGMILFMIWPEFRWLGLAWFLSSVFCLFSWDLCFCKRLCHSQGQPRSYRGFFVSDCFAHWTALRFTAFIVAMLPLTLLIMPAFDSLGVYMLLSLITLPLAQVAIPNAIMRMWKATRDVRFRIVVFKRNDEDVASFHLRVVLPVCGSFGHFISLRDPSVLEKWKPDYQSGESLILEADQFVDSRPGDICWKVLVTDELTTSDFAVFDWTGEVTENMYWEHWEACKLLGVHRVLILISKNTNSYHSEGSRIVSFAEGVSIHVVKSTEMQAERRRLRLKLRNIFEKLN